MSHETNNLCEINYSNLLNKAEAVLDSWKSRTLSLFGKITIINVLVASLFVYKMTVLPSIPQKYVKQLNTMMSRFIWNQKRAKIPLNVLQLSKDMGGAGLVDFAKKDISLKTSWIQTLQTDVFLEELAYHFLCPTVKNFIWECNLKTKDILILFKPSFWTDVLRGWSEWNFEDTMLCPEMIMKQSIWYNSNVRINNAPFLFKIPFNEGLRYVGQLFDIQGELISMDILKSMFQLSTMQLNCIISAIPKVWKQALKNKVEIGKANTNYEMFCKKSKSAAFIYKQLIEKESVLKNAFYKWSVTVRNEIEFDEYVTLFKLIQKLTTNVKLRSFQFRFLHSAIIFNKQLFKWKMKQSNLCTNCKESTENMYHFFFECDYAKRVYKWANDYCRKINSKDQINETDQCILTSLVNQESTHVFNFIFLLAKHYLYVTRCTNKNINHAEFIGRIEKVRSYELYNAKMKNRLYKHVKKWQKPEHDSENKNIPPDMDQHVINYISEL